MLVVADTGPLNYLVWIGSAGFLSEIYGRVVVPPEVRDELLSADAPSVVRAWAGNLPPGSKFEQPRCRFATIRAGAPSTRESGLLLLWRPQVFPVSY